MNTFTHYTRRLLVVLGMAIILAGCVSTQKRYEKGQALEADGRYLEAAGYYVKVLEREPGWADARVRLQEAGDRAVAAQLDAARTAEADGRFDQAVRALDAVADLARRAAAVDVRLAVPDDLDAYRREMTDEAVEVLFRRGETAEEQGRWADAIEAYDRARARYRLTTPQQEALAEARARTLVRWGADDLARGRHRAAYDRAAQVLKGWAPDTPMGRQAQALQQDALAAGTRHIAFLPAGGTDRALDNAPRGLLRALDDVLAYDHWAQPPPFLAAADPAHLHRELRRLRYDRQRITEHQAAEIGRSVDADDVVLVDLTAFSWEEVDRQSERRTARTRGRGAVDTAYVVERYRVRVRGEAAYVVLDSRTRAVVDRGTVTAEAADRFVRGVYAGDARDLDLSRRDRALFDRDALEEAERVLETAFVEDLAQRLASHIYEDLLRRVR